MPVRDPGRPGEGYQVGSDMKTQGAYVPSEPNNWGRWGAEDRRGTANMIDADAIRSAAALVRSGKVFSLAHPIGPATAPHSVIRPRARHYFSETGTDGVANHASNPFAPEFAFNDDRIDMALQGSTQWDGLAHVSSGHTLYNGFWAGTVTARGSTELSIDALRASFVGRGVLLDVARRLDVEALEPGFRIEPELLEQVRAAEGVDVTRGDILLIRTGYMSRWHELRSDADRERFEHAPVPGLTGACVPWLHQREIAALVSDTRCVEVIPSGDPGGRPAPLHVACLVDLGLTLGELWALDELAADCAEDGCWEFLLVAPPLNIAGAVGSPLNPIALK
jgi:kynurenine formamidase